MLDNPCYDKETKTHCTKRYPGCGARCKKWADYVKLRDAGYEQRMIDAMLERPRITNWIARHHQEGRKKK